MKLQQSGEKEQYAALELGTQMQTGTEKREREATGVGQGCGLASGGKHRDLQSRHDEAQSSRVLLRAPLLH